MVFISLFCLFLCLAALNALSDVLGVLFVFRFMRLFYGNCADWHPLCIMMPWWWLCCSQYAFWVTESIFSNVLKNIMVLQAGLKCCFSPQLCTLSWLFSYKNMIFVFALFVICNVVFFIQNVLLMCI